METKSPNSSDILDPDGYRVLDVSSMQVAHGLAVQDGGQRLGHVALSHAQPRGLGAVPLQHELFRRISTESSTSTMSDVDWKASRTWRATSI